MVIIVKENLQSPLKIPKISFTASQHCTNLTWNFLWTRIARNYVVMQKTRDFQRSMNFLCRPNKKLAWLSGFIWTGKCERIRFSKIDPPVINVDTEAKWVAQDFVRRNLSAPLNPQEEGLDPLTCKCKRDVTEVVPWFVFFTLLHFMQVSQSHFFLLRIRKLLLPHLII